MDVSKVSISVVVFSATVVHALRIPHYPMVTSVIALLVIVVRIVSDVRHLSYIVKFYCIYLD